MQKILIPVLLATLLSACAGTKIKEEAKPQVAPPVIAQAVEAPAEKKSPDSDATATTSAVTEKNIAVNPLHDPSNIPFKRSVYFDYDRFDIKPEFRSLIDAHAKYLAEHPRASVRLEGNADDRGSREYNLALGQKRAVAVKKVMNVYGVPDRQVETISYGEEKPKAIGHDESSWAENRRTDIMYIEEQ